MQPDRTGFKYPRVNLSECVDWKLCEKVCPILQKSAPRKPIHVYAVKHLDEPIRLQSSSGGLFSIIAERTLKDGGNVYGAAFDSNWGIHHIAIHNIDDLWKLRGSKYVQSNLNESYQLIKEQLQRGDKVLFSGTPCQIAGLKQFLGEVSPNLQTVEVICHGVPNPRIWQDFLDEQQIANERAKREDALTISEEHSSIVGINFRDKSKGWRNYGFVHYCPVNVG